MISTLKSNSIAATATAAAATHHITRSRARTTMFCVCVFSLLFLSFFRIICKHTHTRTQSIQFCYRSRCCRCYFFLPFFLLFAGSNACVCNEMIDNHKKHKKNGRTDEQSIKEELAIRTHVCNRFLRRHRREMSSRRNVPKSAFDMAALLLMLLLALSFFIDHSFLFLFGFLNGH